MTTVRDATAERPGSDRRPAGEPRVAPVRSCPVCDSAEAVPAFESPDFLHRIPGVYRYVTCERCRTVYQNPRVVPEDIGDCYPETYFTHEPAPATDVVAAGSLRDRLRRAILRRVDGAAIAPDPSLWVRSAARILATSAVWRRRARYGLVDPLGMPAAGARCLEIGPGRGDELLHLSRLGWQAVGLEVDPVAATVAQQTSGCDVFAGRIVDAPWPSETFDLIYASHVFEHLLDPVDALSAMWTLLRPGGRLVLVYPNAHALCARAFGSLAVTWDPPRHIFLAPRRAVHDCLTAVGFSTIQVGGLTRFAYPYAQWARERRSPLPGLRRWLFPGVVRAAEVVGSAFDLDVSEELLVTATRPRADDGPKIAVPRPQDA